LINQNQRILDTETKFRTKEKEKEIVFLNKESDLQQAQIKKRNIILLLSGLIIVIIGGLVIVIQKARKKQVQSNIDLINKNAKIEHQKKEIVDSINYAKRIQDASLGNPEKIKEAHANSAILFQPKDILSGDFYWFSKSENRFSFSVADCTGHGVPGAMMSMIGNNGLNDAVYNNKLSKPSEILEHLSAYVNKNFIKTDVDVKDGMDIAFCSLNTVTGELEYAGALNSLYICKANGEFLDIKADKNYIGQIDSTYTNHKIQLEKGDCIYIMSDGFVDQFGGENNKKFKISNLRTLIQNIHTQTAESQLIVLKNAINSWMKNNEQTDDICLITAMF
jgi:serine phosphatase RsbU (regulator of sigma subunit)